MPPALPTQVEREKLRSHEDTVRLNVEKGRLDRTLTGAELELAEAQRQIQLLEVSVLPTPPLCSPGPSSLPLQPARPDSPEGAAQSQASEGGVLSKVERDGNAKGLSARMRVCSRLGGCAHACGHREP